MRATSLANRLTPSSAVIRVGPGTAPARTLRCARPTASNFAHEIQRHEVAMSLPGEMVAYLVFVCFLSFLWTMNARLGRFGCSALSSLRRDM